MVQIRYVLLMFRCGLLLAFGAFQTVAFCQEKGDAGNEDRRSYLEKGKSAFSKGAEPPAYQFAMAHALFEKENQADIFSQIRWSNNLKRPCYGVTFAVGVILSKDPIGVLRSLYQDQQQAATSSPFKILTGVLGEQLVLEFEKRFTKGDFGRLFQEIESTAIKKYRPTPGLSFVGIGNLGELRENSIKVGYDYLFAIEFRSKKQNSRNDESIESRVILVNLTSGIIIAQSKMVSERNGKILADGKVATLQSALSPLFSFVDKNVVLQNLPELSNEIALKRINSLASKDEIPKIQKLNEIALYHSLKLITHQDLVTAAKTIAGEADGPIFVEGNSEAKKIALDRLLPDISRIETWHRQVVDKDAKEQEQQKAFAEAQKNARLLASGKEKQGNQGGMGGNTKSRYANAMRILENAENDARANGDVETALDCSAAQGALAAMEAGSSSLLATFSPAAKDLAERALARASD